jgi:hypothetical protein
MIISHPVLLGMRNVSDKCIENITKDFLCSIILFSENRAVYDMMCKNAVIPGEPQMTV